MLVKVFYFFVKAVNKIAGLPFSFSNDGEDFVLLKYLSKIEDGNYIDIGSHKPVRGSNTFLFYLLGWKGICIDPLPNLKNKYRFIRSRDKFINAAVFGSNSSNQTDLNFYYYKNHTDNSTFDPERVKQLSDTFGREPSDVIPVPKINVAEIISSNKNFFNENKAINLLSLDIEGFEKDILEDFFSNNIFPWAVCVEEIGQTAETLTNGDIHHLMKNNGYILGSRTFLSSIYILKDQLKNLPSDYIKELEI
tara:strand:+ start:509 stop:1258 length:750 start_codon:yes stop_codon:yes gene_type:complete